MGFRVCLTLVLGRIPDDIHREVGVQTTENYEEFPESAIASATLPNGGYLLYINDGISLDNALLEVVSLGAAVFVCHVNETTMSSSLVCWRNGSEEWSVSHEANLSIDHLESRGPVPALLEPIHQKLVAKQAGVTDIDYIFDTPVELFVAIGGLRYDHDIPNAGTTPWKVLKRIRSTRRWWHFGR